MRQDRANTGNRSNALWGRGSRGESRSNALWGRGGRRAGVTVVMVLAFAMASVAVAGPGPGGNGGGKFGKLKSYVSPDLLSAIQQNPNQTFDVIVQGDPKGGNGHGFIQKILANSNGSSSDQVRSRDVRREFNSIVGGEMMLTGQQILLMAKVGLAQSIVANESVASSGVMLPLSNSQLWPWATGAPVDWLKQSPDAATIAVVDSGVQNRSDFNGRLLGQVN